MDGKNISSIYHWEMIAEKIYETLTSNNRKQIIEDLRRNNYGGGNPGLRFLQILAVRKDDLTVEQFRQTARDVSRYDIANAKFLESAGILRLKLEPESQLELASMLVTGSSGIADWEYFADEYDFPYSVKEQIKQVMNSGGKHSASTGLIEKLIKDEWTIERLEKVCEDVGGLNQIKNKLVEFKT